MAFTMNWGEVRQNRGPEFTLSHDMMNIKATLDGLATDPALAIM
jgi:hypothetical protein